MSLGCTAGNLSVRLSHMALDLWTLSLRVVPSCFDDEHSVCSVHKTHTSQTPITEVIFDTRKYPVSQWANHRAVSADRILLPVWAEIKQQHCSHSLAEQKIIESLNEKPGYCTAILLWEWKETNWTVQSMGQSAQEQCHSTQETSWTRIQSCPQEAKQPVAILSVFFSAETQRVYHKITTFRALSTPKLKLNPDTRP